MLLHAESINFKNLGIEQHAPIPEVFREYVTNTLGYKLRVVGNIDLDGSAIYLN